MVPKKYPETHSRSGLFPFVGPMGTQNLKKGTDLATVRSDSSPTVPTSVVFYLSSVLYPRMLQCLLKEWRCAQVKHKLKAVSTIFFGGGTPSLMPLSLIETLVKEISGEKEVGTIKSFQT